MRLHWAIVNVMGKTTTELRVGDSTFIVVHRTNLDDAMALSLRILTN